METLILQPTKENYKLAATEIKNGGLVAFATETVYGLGADAFNKKAVEKIFLAKGRPNDNPLIVHFSDIADIEKAAILTPMAIKAAEFFMPGPLTIVLQKKENLPNAVTAGLNTVGVRIPSNKTAQEFIKECGTGIAAPSANTSTKPSPTKAIHVYDDLNGKIKYILDGGECEKGLESTILDLSSDKIRLLRQGAIPIEDLESVLGKIEIISKSEKPLSPGMKYRHYAPNAKIIVFNSGEKIKILNEYFKLKQKDTPIRVLGVWNNNQIKMLKEAGVDLKDFVLFCSDQDYAHNLYAELRQSDKLNTEIILCELVSNIGIGCALNNRIFKAAGQE